MSRIALMLVSLIVGAAVVLAQTTHSTQSDTKSGQSPRAAVVLQVAYFAQPGKAEEVFATRQQASDLLEKLGLPRGRVMRRAGGTGDDPDVMWECEYPDAAALELALKTATASSEFERVRKHMGTLIRKGELRKWEVLESSDEKR